MSAPPVADRGNLRQSPLGRERVAVLDRRVDVRRAATGVADDKRDQLSFADRVQERSGEGLQEGAGGEAALRVLTVGPCTDHA
jgi:hypothetical protein